MSQTRNRLLQPQENHCVCVRDACSKISILKLLVGFWGMAFKKSAHARECLRTMLTVGPCLQPKKVGLEPGTANWKNDGTSMRRSGRSGCDRKLEGQWSMAMFGILSRHYLISSSLGGIDIQRWIARKHEIFQHNYADTVNVRGRV